MMDTKTAKEAEACSISYTADTKNDTQKATSDRNDKSRLDLGVPPPYRWVLPFNIMIFMAGLVQMVSFTS
jgi:hypothetical protein